MDLDVVPSKLKRTFLFAKLFFVYPYSAGGSMSLGFMILSLVVALYLFASHVLLIIYPPPICDNTFTKFFFAVVLISVNISAMVSFADLERRMKALRKVFTSLECMEIDLKSVSFSDATKQRFAVFVLFLLVSSTDLMMHRGFTSVAALSLHIPALIYCGVLDVYSDTVSFIGGCFDQLKKAALRRNAVPLTYASLCDACQATNDAFSAVITSIFLTTYFVLAISSYFAIVFFTMSGGEEFLFLGLVRFFTIIMHFIPVFQVCRTSYRTSLKAKYFTDLMYLLMMNDNSNFILQNSQYQLHIYLKREVKFTGGGFFALDYTSIHSMIASVATFLVILVQFGDTASLDGDSIGEIFN